MLQHSAVSRLLLASVLVVCTAFGAISGSGNSRLIRLMQVADSGHVTNCGPTNFSVTWTPKVLTGYDPIWVEYDYVAPYTLSAGSIHLTIWYLYQGEFEVLFDYVHEIHCNPTITQLLPCPLSKGVHLKKTLQLPFQYTAALRGYQGQFKGQVSIKNQDGKIMICGRAKVTVNNN